MGGGDTGIGYGIKPYGCEVCGRACIRRVNLSERSRVNTGEKPCKGVCLMVYVLMGQRVP